MSETHTRDFNLWIEQTAQLLRSHRWDKIDLELLIEEVEGLGKSERRAIVKIINITIDSDTRTFSLNYPACKVKSA